MRGFLHFGGKSACPFDFAQGRNDATAGWDEEAEAGWEWDSAGVGVGEGNQDGGAGFAWKKVRGVCIERCEEPAGGIERGCEEDGVEGFGGLLPSGVEG